MYLRLFHSNLNLSFRQNSIFPTPMLMKTLRFPSVCLGLVNDRKGLWQSKPGLTGASCGQISAARGYRKAWAALNYGPYARSLVCTLLLVSH